ncbi:MAG: FtsB family cell division protein [Bacteroidia bacterium]
MFRKVFKIIFNKYLLTVVGISAWLTFFDHNDIFTQYELKQQVLKLEKERDYYLREVIANRKATAELTTNKKSLEKFARETYRMKRDNEDVFVIVKK